MKIINIPSVNSEKCNTSFKFHENSNGVDLSAIDIECQTPVFKASLQVCIDNDLVQNFTKDLELVEKERKETCNMYDEWCFGFTIRSIDSLGHFRVEVNIRDQRDSLGYTQEDELNIAYEIEPSLLTDLVKQFKKLQEKSS